MDAIDREVNGAVLGFGVDLYLEWQLAKHLVIRPVLGAAYFGGGINAQAEKYDPDDPEISYEDANFDSGDIRNVRISYGASIQLNELVITPLVQIQDDGWFASVAMKAAIPSKSEW